MSRCRPSHLVTLDGVGITKPSTTRAAAVRARDWWSRRLRIDLDVVHLKGSTP